jgi:hypothetical protein
MSKHTIKVYGTAPAFQVTVVADCQEGLIGTLILDQPSTSLEGSGRQTLRRLRLYFLPSFDDMPDSVYQLQEHCSSPSGKNIGCGLLWNYSLQRRVWIDALPTFSAP